MGTVFSRDYQSKPYWWNRTSRPVLDEIELPSETDVAIIGSGHTGLCAAIQTSRNQKSTVVLDTQDTGWVGSSRNGGQVSTSLKPGFDVLYRKYGEDKARAILKEGIKAMDWIGNFINGKKLTAISSVSADFSAHTPRSSFGFLSKRSAISPKDSSPI